MVIIPYYPVRDETLKKIVSLKLGKIRRRMMENHKLELDTAQDLIDAVAARCTEVESGARNVDNILTNTMLPDMARQLLGAMAEGRKIGAIRVEVGPDGAFVYSATEAGARAEGGAGGA
jgi:type VI secretion system protein VasG